MPPQQRSELRNRIGLSDGRTMIESKIVLQLLDALDEAEAEIEKMKPVVEAADLLAKCTQELLAEPTPQARRFKGIGEIYELRNGVVHHETTKTNIPVRHIFDCVKSGLLHEIDADGNRIETPEAKP